MKRIAVIGAGPAGITAAYEISKKIKSKDIARLDLYEAGSDVGGLSRSLTLWNQTVDLGPHRFFSNDNRINKLWLEVAGDEYDMVNRQTRIFYKNKFFDYPLKASNALINMGIVEAFLCITSYIKEKIVPTPQQDTFEWWVTNRFGKRLYRMFFKTYSEKLWGIPCTELDSDFAAQRIKKFSMGEAIKSALFGNRGNKHKTLVDQFAYPFHGTGSIYQKMKSRIESNGGIVHLNRPVEKILTRDNKAYAILLDDGQIEEYDQIVSTMPLSLMVTRLPDVPESIVSLANSLKFRNTILVFLKVENTQLFTDQWLYIHSDGIEMGRITNFRNWLPTLYGEEKNSILCVEYWANFEDKLWNLSNEELIQIAKDEVIVSGLNKNSIISDGYVHKLPRCYPVYFSGYKQKLKPIEQFLDSIEGIHVIGRYGSYKYNNQDHSILMGILAAENITENTNHNLWEINTDYESYQESSVITKTGLQKK